MSREEEDLDSEMDNRSDESDDIHPIDVVELVVDEETIGEADGVDADEDDEEIDEDDFDGEDADDMDEDEFDIEFDEGADDFLPDVDEMSSDPEDIAGVRTTGVLHTISCCMPAFCPSPIITPSGVHTW